MSQLKNKSIAITGGTGTIGRACVDEILRNYSDVKKIIIYSRDELKQLEMMEQYPEKGDVLMKYFIGDVRDVERLLEVFKEVDYVIHAAAIKHVVMAEKNPEECWKTNVAGTRNVVNACQANGIFRAVLISTDKAVNPKGVYGNSKQKAEKLFLEANSNSRTKFRVVRLGNIIGSRGSVWEAFAKQKQTGTLKVTHPDATRFCIEKKEAVDFVFSKIISKEEKTISSPKMNAICILDFAKSIAPECNIEITGLREGDKLHEELDGVSSKECLKKTQLPVH